VITGTLTLFTWSLRADTRTLWPHIVRAAFAAFMILSIGAAFMESLSLTGPGLLFFHNICVLNYLLIAVAGISYFVSAVTEEKDSGTLSLLRLAGVSPIQIILGKSTSRLISSLMLLWIQLPFTFLAITLGGVTWRQIIACYVLLAAWMAFVANVSLLASVRCRTAGRAAGVAFLTLVGLLWAPSFITFTVPSIPPRLQNPAVIRMMEDAGEWLASINVLGQFRDILSPSAINPPVLVEAFWWYLLAGAACFVSSVLLFDFWLVPTDESAGAGQPLLRRYTIGRCWRLAMVWKDFLFFTGGRTFFVAKLIGYGGLVLGAVVWQSYDRNTSAWSLTGDYCWLTFLSMVVIMNIEVMLYASGSLFSEVRQTTLSSLSMLPYRTSRLLLEKILAGLLALVPAMVWMGIVALSDPTAIQDKLSASMVVTGVFILLLSGHLTVLLSLYTRWGALPLAVLATVSALMCCPVLLIPVFGMADWVARSHNFRFGLLLGAVLNLVWGWLFLLLPMELEIVRRWERLAQME
jgi:ABC-type transport system involved in multi-copper enzyme maturation permease subunit